MRSLLVSPAHSVFGSPTPIFINKLGIQSLAVVTPTSKEGNNQNAMPQLVYPTRPRTSNACKRKKKRFEDVRLISKVANGICFLAGRGAVGAARLKGEDRRCRKSQKVKC